MNYQRKSAEEIKVYPINLDGLLFNEQVIVISKYKEDTISKTILEYQQFNPATMEWGTKYKWENIGLTVAEVENGYWEAVDSNIVILKAWQGSGSFLSYKVFGLVNGKVTEYLNEESIFQGNVFLENNQLIQSSGNQYRKWVRFKDFMLVPYRIPILAGAYLVEYKITPESKVITNKHSFNIPVGGIIQFIRLDNNDIGERLIYQSEDNEDIKYIEHRSAYQFLDKLNATFTIVPGGYDFENAKDIVVVSDGKRRSNV